MTVVDPVSVEGNDSGIHMTIVTVPPYTLDFAILICLIALDQNCIVGTATINLLLYDMSQNYSAMYYILLSLLPKAQCLTQLCKLIGRVITFEFSAFLFL